MATVAGHRAFLFSPLQASLRALWQPITFLAHYNVRDFRPDLVAGITTGILLVPQSVAYALIAELPAQIGLYTAIVAAVTASLWGSSRHLHTGPTNAASLLVLTTVAPLVSSSSVQEYVAVVGLLSVMVGLMRLVLGLLRLGFIVNFVSDAVIVGFTAGASLLIVVNQISGLLGLHIPASAQFYRVVQALWHHQEPLNYLSLGLGLATLALILVLPLIRRQLPAQFLAVLIVSLAVAVLRLDLQGIEIIGPMPRTLPPLQALPLADWDLWRALMPGASAIALIGLVEALTISRTLATESGQYLDNNQEMVGQGLANIICGFLSGYCSSGSFTRSTVNHAAGGRTQMTSILSGLFVLGAIFGLGFAIQFLSRPVLAGFVIATAFAMIKYRRMRQIMATSKSETFIMAVTFLSAFVFPLVYVVAIGIVLSLLVYVYKTSRPRVIPMVPTANFRHLRAAEDTDALCPQLTILSIEGDLYFGAANHVEHLLRDYLPPEGTRHFILLQMQNTVRVDISGVRLLESLVRLVRERGGDVYFFKITDIANRLFVSSGFRALVGEDHFLEDDTAIEYLFQRVLNAKECIYDCPHRVFHECQNLPKIALPFQDLLLNRGPDDLQLPRTDVDSVFRRLTARDPVLDVIDVREQLEWDRGHIPQARHMPYSAFSPDNPALNPEREIVLVSNTTRRARNIGFVLQEHGFSHVRILAGGMRAWMAAGHITALSEYSRI